MGHEAERAQSRHRADDAGNHIHHVGGVGVTANFPGTSYEGMHFLNNEIHDTAEEGEASAYGIRAPYSRWREVVLGDLEPVKAMVQGKLKLRGDLANIVRHVRAAKELVHLTTLVPTEFLGSA